MPIKNLFWSVWPWLCAVLWLSMPMTVLPNVASNPIAGGGLPLKKPAQLFLVAETLNIDKKQKELTLGLKFLLDDGWKTYWRNPGDAGLPMRVRWKKRDNVESIALFWPSPTRYEEYGLQSVGYEKEVIFPLEVTMREAGRPITLEADISYLACRDICLPLEDTVFLHVSVLDEDNVPANTPRGVLPSGDADAIAHYASLVPVSEDESPMRIHAVGASETSPWQLRVVARSQRPFDAPDIFVEEENDLWFSEPHVTLREGRKVAIFLLDVSGQSLSKGPPLGERDVRLTIVDTHQNIDTWRRADGYFPPAQKSVADIVKESGEGSDISAYLTIIAFALFGGFILNFMPCVLPVLSLKLVGIATASHDKTLVREGFAASVLGILFSFALLGGIVLSLKELGMSLGWGFHFQQPIFIMVMAYVMVIFACNLLGWFEIGLPRFVRAMLPAGEGKRYSVHYENFSNGVLATTLATPCSAPFLGTAVGFALAGDALDIMMVFLMLGTGFAIPWLLVVLFPGGGARWLPRPGPWIMYFRRSLSLPLFATALWLVSILPEGILQDSLLLIAISMVGIIALFFIYRKRASRPLWFYGAVMGVVALSTWMIDDDFSKRGLYATEKEIPTVQAGIDWTSFAPEEIQARVAEGHVVFVDITAAWCLTCKANKLLVLDDEDIISLFVRNKIIAQQGDVTLPDADIAQWMASLGRYGVPLNVVFGPRRPEGIVLPELLSVDIVTKSLRDASVQGSLQ
ncbi:MAG: thioredoxin family protein [Alphaproteobacteria bacterium GM7ARS4]|nr:thioredoxin family protein [Alphaproteobacteria bacterium GM7ARS4]